MLSEAFIENVPDMVKKKKKEHISTHFMIFSDLDRKISHTHTH